MVKMMIQAGIQGRLEAGEGLGQSVVQWVRKETQEGKDSGA